MKNVVIKGDCLEEMKNIPDGSVDMILTDLPYGTTACSWDTIIPFEPMWEHFKRVIKRNGAIVLTASQPFTSKLVMSNLGMFKYEWIWEKTLATGHLTANKQPMKEHENILVYYKETPTYNTQKSKSKPYYKKNKGTYEQSKGTKRIDSVSVDGTRFPRSIIKIRSANTGSTIGNSSKHPTQKPVDLFRYLIRTYTNEGETVLDCCAGSGTTGVACIIEKRNYILIEQEQKYIDVIHKRLELEHSKLTLF